jgi:UDP-GlcNAc3NAcA epimerase
MLHILTIIGARPQIIKAAALNRAVSSSFGSRIRETLVHTGQHYDENMSKVFFSEMAIPEPTYNLEIGSGSHGSQTAAMIAELERIMIHEKPGAVVVYGDTNSTLAGAIAASKIHIPVVHIEAGLRSYNRAMPEEINRVVCDHVSTLLFSPTKAGYDNLAREGIAKGKQPKRATADHPAVYHCGDIMLDNTLYFGSALKTSILAREKLEAGRYFLATVHRDFNTDNPELLKGIFKAFENIAQKHTMPVVVPLHPRTQKELAKQGLTISPLIKIMEPVSYPRMLSLEKNAALVLTDSGGVQKEAFFCEKPCVILREETEWVELVECGAAILAGTAPGKIERATDELLGKKIDYPAYFGDGQAAEFMCREMLHHLG